MGSAAGRRAFVIALLCSLVAPALSLGRKHIGGDSAKAFAHANACTHHRSLGELGKYNIGMNK